MANRFWVGGSGDFNDTAHWSTTSGGASGASVPGTLDTAVFNSASHTTNYTVTIDAPGVCCQGFTVAAPAAGNMTLAGSQPISLVSTGVLTLYAGMVNNYTGTVSLVGCTITSAGVAWNSPFVLGTVPVANAGNSFTITLVDALNIGSNAMSITRGCTFSGNFAITCGALTYDSATNSTQLVFAGQTVNCSSFATTQTTGSNKVVNLGSSTWNCTGTWTIQVSTLVTSLILGTAVVNCTAWSVLNTTCVVTNTSSTINCTGLTHNGTSAGVYGTVVITTAVAAMDWGTTQFTATAVTLNSTVDYPIITFSSTRTYTIGTLTLSGSNAAEKRLMLAGSTVGNVLPIVTFSCNTVSLTNVTMFSVVGSGAASPFTGTSLGNAGNNSGITFTGAVTRYWVGNGGAYSSTTHWSTSSGGASGASVPLPQDTAIFDANSFSLAGQTVTISGATVAIVTSTAVTNNPAFDLTPATTPVSGLPSHYLPGALTLGTMTWSGTSVLVLGGGSVSWNLGSVSIGSRIKLAKTGTTLTLASNLTVSGGKGFLLASGTINGAGFAVSISGGVAANTGTVTMGGGTWTAGGTDTGFVSAIWSSGGTALTIGGSRLVLDTTTLTANTTASGTQTFSDVTIQGTSIYTVTVSFPGANDVTVAGACGVLWTGATVRDIYHTGSSEYVEFSSSSIRDIYKTGTGPLDIEQGSGGTIRNVSFTGVGAGFLRISGDQGTGNSTLTGTFVVTDFPKMLIFGGLRTFTTTPTWSGTGPDALFTLASVNPYPEASVENYAVLAWPVTPEVHMDYMDVAAGVVIQGVANLTYGNHSRVCGGFLRPSPNNTALLV